MQIFFVFDDDGAHQAGRFIDISLDRDTRDHVAEFNLAALVGQNRDVVWVPLHERLAFFHMRAVVFRNHRTDNDVVALELTTFRVVHADRTILAQHDPAAIERLHCAQIVEAHRAVILRFNDRLFESLARRSADVECSHRQLRSWFADRLSGNNSNRFAHFHILAGGQISSVTHSANAATAFARQHRADLQALYTDALQICRDFLVDELVGFDDLLLLVHWVRDCFAANAADDSLGKIDNFLVALVNRADDDSVYGAAIFYIDNNVLCRVDQFTGEITGVRSFERGVGQTFARAVGRDEILEHAQTFAEVGSDRSLDNFSARFRHQAAHASELTHLLAIAARPGVNHQINWIQFFAAVVVFQCTEHDVRNLVAGVRPDIDDLVVTLAVRDDAFSILLLDLANLFISVFELGLFFLRNDHVRNSNRDSGPCRLGEAKLFQLIECRDRCRWSCDLIAAPDNVAELLFAGGLVEKPEFLWPNLIENDATGRRFDRLRFRGAENSLSSAIRILKTNSIVCFDRAFGHGEFHFDWLGEERQMAVLFHRSARILRHVIATEPDVLRRRRDRFAAGRRENVIRCEHQHARFQLRLDRERHVHSHLIAIEVRIVRGADERVNPDRFAFDQLWLEGLDRQSMQRRPAAEQHRMFAGDFFKYVA